MKILLIDDDNSIRELLRVSITMENPDADVLEAAHGDGAFQTCRDERPDALVVDGHLPGMTGDALGAALRALVPSAKIVSFTGIQGEVAWADVQVVKATDDAVGKVVAAVLGN